MYWIKFRNIRNMFEFRVNTQVPITFTTSSSSYDSLTRWNSPKSNPSQRHESIADRSGSGVRDLRGYLAGKLTKFSGWIKGGFAMGFWGPHLKKPSGKSMFCLYNLYTLYIFIYIYIYIYKALGWCLKTLKCHSFFKPGESCGTLFPRLPFQISSS